MQALVSGAVAAAASGSPVQSCVCRQPLAAAVSTLPAQRPRRWQSSSSSSSHGGSRSPWMPLASDVARQRRLVAASAAAQPALAEEDAAGWEEAAVAAAVATLARPAVEPPAADAWRRQPRASLAAAGAAALEACSRAEVPLPSLLAAPEAAPAPPMPRPAAHPLALPVPNLGYTCMNVELQQKYGMRTNRRVACCCC